MDTLFLFRYFICSTICKQESRKHENLNSSVTWLVRHLLNVSRHIHRVSSPAWYIGASVLTEWSRWSLRFTFVHGKEKRLCHGLKTEALTGQMTSAWEDCLLPWTNSSVICVHLPSAGFFNHHKQPACGFPLDKIKLKTECGKQNELLTETNSSLDPKQIFYKILMYCEARCVFSVARAHGHTQTHTHRKNVVRLFVEHEKLTASYINWKH